MKFKSTATKGLLEIYRKLLSKVLKIALSTSETKVYLKTYETKKTFKITFTIYPGDMDDYFKIRKKYNSCINDLDTQKLRDDE